MAASFYSRAVGRVKQVFQQATTAAKTKFGSTITVTPGGKQGMASARVDPSTADAVAKLDAISTVMGSGRLPRTILESLADTARDTMKDKIDPISRTGRLRDSITSRVTTNFRSEVRSSAEYAQQIAEGEQGVPPPSALEKWMERKPEFASMDSKQRRRVSFAIFFSIKKDKNQNKTGRSDITNLPPTGERRYDFIKATLDEMGPEIDSIGAVINQGLIT